VNKLYWDETISKMTGHKYYKPRGKYFFNVTQIALINLNASSGDFSYFSSFTCINGYQVVPAFAIGLGVTFNNYSKDFLDIHTNYYYYHYYYSSSLENGHVHYLPVYLDLRVHPPSRSRLASPFIKFDIGYNILLQRIQFHAVDPTYNYSLTMDKGGIYLSPGLGLRIFVNRLVQIYTSVEYSFEKSGYYFGTYENEVYDKKFHSLKFNLGVGFQYK
jgi:hypothetical protein